MLISRKTCSVSETMQYAVLMNFFYANLSVTGTTFGTLTDGGQCCSAVCVLSMPQRVLKVCPWQTSNSHRCIIIVDSAASALCRFCRLGRWLLLCGHSTGYRARKLISSAWQPLQRTGHTTSMKEGQLSEGYHRSSLMTRGKLHSLGLIATAGF